MTETQEIVATIIAIGFFWAAFLVPEFTLMWGAYYFIGIVFIGRDLRKRKVL